MVSGGMLGEWGWMPSSFMGVGTSGLQSGVAQSLVICRSRQGFVAYSMPSSATLQSLESINGAQVASCRQAQSGRWEMGVKMECQDSWNAHMQQTRAMTVTIQPVKGANRRTI